MKFLLILLLFLCCADNNYYTTRPASAISHYVQAVGFLEDVKIMNKWSVIRSGELPLFFHTGHGDTIFSEFISNSDMNCHCRQLVSNLKWLCWDTIVVISDTSWHVGKMVTAQNILGN